MEMRKEKQKMLSLLLSFLTSQTVTQHNMMLYICNTSLTSDPLRTSIKESIFLSVYSFSSGIDLPSFFSCLITPLLITQFFIISMELQTLFPGTLVYPEQLLVSSNPQIVLVSVFKTHGYSIVLQLEINQYSALFWIPMLESLTFFILCFLLIYSSQI